MPRRSRSRSASSRSRSRSRSRKRSSSPFRGRKSSPRSGRRSRSPAKGRRPSFPRRRRSRSYSRSRSGSRGRKNVSGRSSDRRGRSRSPRDSSRHKNKDKGRDRSQPSPKRNTSGSQSQGISADKRRSWSRSPPPKRRHPSSSGNRSPPPRVRSASPQQQQRRLQLPADVSTRLSPDSRGGQRSVEHISTKAPLRERSPFSPSDMYTVRAPNVGNTKTPLDSRFKSINIETRPVTIDENITIGIHRNVRGESPVVARRRYDIQSISVVRRAEEGAKPIFEREELIGKTTGDLEDDVEERRIIQVSKLDRHDSYAERMSRAELEAELDDINYPPQRSERMEERSMRTAVVTAWEDAHRSRLDEKSFSRKGTANPNDLRHSLSKRKSVSDRGEVSSDIRQRLGNVREEKRKGDKGSKGDLSQRLLQQAHSSTDNLPDFAQRPDKGTYEPWKDKPELIPKGSSYFLHDNRGEFDYWEKRGRGRGRGRGWGRGRGDFRGRGRGEFRGRGDFRGGRGYSNRGRNYQSRDRDRDDRSPDRRRDSDRDRDRSRGADRDKEWKHDMFEKVKEEEQKPSSTTENQVSSQS